MIQRYQLEINSDLSTMSLVFGCKAQKDFKSIIDFLVTQDLGEVILVTSCGKEHLMADPFKMLEIASTSTDKFQVVTKQGLVGESLIFLLERPVNDQKNLIVIGSFNLMIEARVSLGYQDYVDPPVVMT